MLKFIDNFLNRITMYRLILYYLLALLGIAIALSFFGLIPLHPLPLIFTSIILVAVCWLTNNFFAAFLQVPTNVESSLITGLILSLIIPPPSFASALFAIVPFLLWTSIWAMLSKYMVNIKNKHIFNPAAFGVALTALTMHQSATWWVGSAPMFIFVLLGALLMIRKVRRFDAAISFIIVSLLTTIVFSLGSGHVISAVYKTIVSTSLIFFAAVMLTEPLTMPPTRRLRIVYAAIVGFLFSPQLQLGSLYFTPELALLTGNIFSYLVSPKGRYVLQLKDKIASGTMIGDFVFATDRPMRFRPGQYMEWTLGLNHPDNRGNRRYFTIASSPTEDNLLLGVKFYPNSSTFKQRLSAMKYGEEIIASQVAGDFVLPRNKEKKLVFIAGGIGITPFRSMVKYLMDTNDQRSIVLFYSSKSADEIVYNDIFSQAKKIGLKTVYTLTDPQVPADWQGYQGYINAEMITKEVPDYLEREFYISGSHTMVSDFKEMLKNLGVAKQNIKTDFFPGLA